MSEENYSCDFCGREFDSERGLHIHQSQMHEEEDIPEPYSEEKTETPEPYSEETETPKPYSEETETPKPYSGDSKIPAPYSGEVSLGFRTVMIGVFVLGLAVGFSSGLLVSGMNMPALQMDSGENTGEFQESTIDVLRDIASQNGVDADAMEDYVRNGSTDEIEGDRREIARAAGSIGTPTFFIGNSEIGYTKISGAQPYPMMKPVIDRKLQEARSGNSTIGEDELRLDSISLEGEPTMGESDAPINIIEYSDYGCPWCAEWHGVDAISQRNIDQEESFSRVRDTYVADGDVRFVAKDYPVSQLHPEAVKAHLAANYVWENNPESFWEFSQSIYERRDEW